LRRENRRTTKSGKETPAKKKKTPQIGSFKLQKKTRIGILSKEKQNSMKGKVYCRDGRGSKGFGAKTGTQYLDEGVEGENGLEGKHYKKGNTWSEKI